MRLLHSFSVLCFNLLFSFIHAQGIEPSGLNVLSQFSLKPNSNFRCPEVIEHHSIVQKGTRFSIPHEDISHDGIKCASLGELAIMDDDDFETITASVRLIANESNTLISALFQMKSPLVTGAEDSKRVCGSSKIDQGSSVLFIKNDGTASINDFPSSRNGTLFMIIYDPSIPEPCIYAADSSMNESIPNSTPDYEEPLYLEEIEITATPTPTSSGHYDDAYSKSSHPMHSEAVMKRTTPQFNVRFTLSSEISLFEITNLTFNHLPYFYYIKGGNIFFP